MNDCSATSYNSMYLVRALPSHKLPSATSFIRKTLDESALFIENIIFKEKDIYGIGVCI